MSDDMNETLVSPSMGFDNDGNGDEEKKNNTPLIIGIVVAVVLCCCCVTAGLLYQFGDQLVAMF